MVRVQVDVTVHQLVDEFRLTKGETVAGKLSSLSSQGKVNTLTKTLTINGVDKIERLFTLENVKEFLSKSGLAGYPYMRVDVTYTEV